MENLDLTAVTRMGLILAHLLAFAAAFAAVAFGDFAIFRRRRVDTELLTKAANSVTLALTALWITGFAVILLDTRLDLALLWGKPKLLAKLTIAGLLTINGIATGDILGKLIGSGAEITGKVLGRYRVPTSKGQAMAAYDPRGVKGTGVTYATSPMGADHTAGNTPRAQVQQNSK